MGILAVLILLVFFNLRKFYTIKKIAREKKWLTNVLALILSAAIFVIGYFTNMVYVVVIVLNFLIVIWILDFIGWILGKITNIHPKIYVAGIIAIIFTACYLTYGYFNDLNIVRTDYSIKTSKTIPDKKFRIAQIADAHVGTTFNGKELGKYVDEISKTNPDIFVITGDLIDDDTTKQDMIDTCKSLGRAKTKYGIYYVQGNHDEAYFADRGYEMKDFEKELKDNGVTYLKDEVKLIDDSVYLVGRLDRRHRDDRKETTKLMKGLDKKKYTIVLDHQPYDFNEQSNTNPDLVLCGHTHGGQLIPIGYLGELYGSYEKAYGIKKVNNTVFEVSSGISGWGVPYKTGAVSEYVIIDVNGR